MRRGGTRAARAAWLAVLLALYGASALGAAPAPFLWHVQGRVATSYLVGAVHLLPSSADSLPAALEQAYDETNGAVFETDLGALQSRAVQLRFMAAGQVATALRHRVSARLYARVAQQMQALGMPPALCGWVRAWWCAVSLGIYQFERAGFSEEYGIDNHFYGEAVADGKTVQWFETPAAHLALFSGMDRRLGRAMLRAAVAPDDSGLASPQAVYRAWRDDDVA
ncbi:MAG TPA: TraB/GumN family protein, partial [Nevskiaceae bacterium]|nr:TraB/GumN family protein [Nevskiaceae bacterium]